MYCTAGRGVVQTTPHHHPGVANARLSASLGRRRDAVEPAQEVGTSRHQGRHDLEGKRPRSAGKRAFDPETAWTHHECEGHEGEGRHGASEPEDLAVGDQDDGQVLEDGVDGNREVLLQESGEVSPSPGTGIPESRTSDLEPV